MPISCRYCGGHHDRPGDVRICWENSSAGRGPGGGSVGPQRPDDPPAGTGRAAGLPADAAPAVARRGHPALGRNVIVGSAGSVPPDWHDSERIVVDDDVRADPDRTIARLRSAAFAARSSVIEIRGGHRRRRDDVDERDPYRLRVDFGFTGEELDHLIFSNSIDVRDPAAPRWELLDAAVAAGATLDPNGVADVVLPDGTPAWLDGGPLRHHDRLDGIGVLPAVSVEHGSLRTLGPNSSTADLAVDQLAAVTHPGGAARVIAPAGSGKTRVLTERARHLIRNWNLPPSAVTLVAFNKRAQREMSERTSDLPGLDVRTLNSIALAIVNGTAPFEHSGRRWRTIDEPDVRRILRRLVETPRALNVDPYAPWIVALGQIRLGLVDPSEVMSRHGGDVPGLNDVYPDYVEALERDGLVDFDGQIHRAIRLLCSSPSARHRAQRASRVLLVDEFQDLTPAHLLLVRLLAAPGGAVFGVGDDDQTIYGYNGADPAWLIDFDDWFPGAGDHPLQINYRCPAGVVEQADRLLRHNRRRVPKTITAASTETTAVVSRVTDDVVHSTVSRIVDLIGSGAGVDDIAVLARVNALLAPVQVALHDAGVPVVGGVDAGFVDRTAIRASLAWIRVACGDAWAPADLTETMRRPPRSMSPRVREWAAEQRDVAGLTRLAGRLNNSRDSDAVNGFAADIGRLQALCRRRHTTERIVDMLVTEIGLGGAVATLDRNRTGMNRAAQGDDLRALAHLAALHPDPATFEDWLRSSLDRRPHAGRPTSGVTLATVHRVKGQQWPHVIVHAADSDQFPHRLADDLEEERRLFHVAITRAETTVAVTAVEPSPFIGQLESEPSADPVDEPARGTPPAPSVDRRSERPSGHPLLDRDRVIPAPGLVLVDQGQQWTIVAVTDDGAKASCGAAVRTFPFESSVVTAGRRRGRLRRPPEPVDDASVRADDRLRSYRERARNGKPAYTVFDDRTLVAIAVDLPDDLDRLADIKGIGPTKLEVHGASLLDIVAQCSVFDPAL